MPSLEELLQDLADLHEQTAVRIREYVEEAKASTVAESPVDERVVRAARAIHSTMGARQEEILRHIASAHPDGVGTGYLSKTMNYDQPNVYLTLKAMIRQGLIVRDEKASPHRYGLSEKLHEAAEGKGK